MGSSKKHKVNKERKKRHRSKDRSTRKHAVSSRSSKSYKRKRDHYDSDAEKDRAPLAKKDVEVINLSNDDDDEPKEVKVSGETLSISETNKLRAKLGLKPLQVESEIPGLGQANQDAEGAVDENGEPKEEKKEVFVRTENMKDIKKAEMLREKLQVNKERRKILEKLRNVKGLGESDSEDDASKWVEKSRKLQEEKDQANKRAKMLEEMDAEFGIGALVEEEFLHAKQRTYGMRDLKGLAVGHSTASFKEGEMVILTLKDQGVLEEGEDVLVNVNFIDDEKANKNVENKKKKPEYEAYEEPEFDEFGILKKRTMLSKYDEELDGPKKKAFKIGGGSGMDKEKELELIRMKLKQKQGVTLEMPALKIASEYLTPDEMVMFKKPKKKRKVMRKRSGLKPEDIIPLPGQSAGKDHGSRNRKSASTTASDLLNKVTKEEPVDMEIDNAELEESDILGPEEDLTGVSVDDDKAELELELALHKTRKLKQQEGRAVGIEKFARAMQIKREPLDENNPLGTEVVDKTSIILNSVAEFCRTLGDIPTYGLSGNREDEVDDMQDMEQEMAGDEWKQPESDELRSSWNEVEIEDQPVEIPKERENEPILEEEPDVSIGLGGALKLAMKKGYLETENKKLAGANRNSLLQAQSYTIEEKFYEDDKFGRRDRYTGPIQDFREKDTYKPEVKLEYIDDGGRLLNEKEAFRYLSHKFHGKGPGKNKVDKRTKKLEQEGKLKQMSSTDTPLNTLKLLQEKQRDLQTPYILLSGGSKALTQTSITKSK